MKYSHFSFLPIDAFRPILGRMRLHGGDNPVSAISDFVSNAVSDVVPEVEGPIQQIIEPITNIPQQIDQQIIQPVSNEVSNAAQTVGDVGNQIDQSVNNDIPGGWATVGAVAATVATAGAAGAFDAAAAEADTAATAADVGTTAADVGTSAAADTLPAVDTSAVATDAGAQTAAQTGLDNLVAQQNDLYPAVGNTIVGLPQVGNAALSGAAKGALTNVAIDAITGQPITPQGLLTSAATGGAGGVAGNVAGQLGAGTVGSGVAGGTAGGTTGALLNNGNVGQGALTGALTGGVSGATNQLLSDQSAPVTAAGQSVATGLTNVALSGNTNNLAQNLVGGALASAGLTSGANALLNPSTPATSNPDDAFNQALVNAMQNPTDTSQNTSGLVAGSGTGIPSVSIGNDALSNTQELTQKQQYEQLMQEPGMDSATASELSGYNPSNDTTVVTPISDATNTAPSSSVTPTTPTVDLTPINNQLASLTTDQQAQAQALINQGATTQQAIDAVQTNLQGQIGGLGTQVGNLNTGLSSANTGIASNTSAINNLGTTVEQNQATNEANQQATNDALSSLSSAQQQEVANQVSMGVNLTAAINNVQSSTNQQLGALQTSLKNQQIAAATPSSTTSSGGSIPTPISGQSLAGAPVYNTNTQLLQQLQQLDPSLLAKIAPQLVKPSAQSGALMQSGLSALNPSSQTTSGQQQSNPYASLLQTMLSDKGGSNPTNSLLSSGLASLSGSAPGYKKGGRIEHDDSNYEHKPEFITGATGHYVKGRGDGQSDDIPAMLADGEYVFDADTVAALGNGSSDAGAKLLDHFRESLRAHKRSAPNDKIPPKASPLMYMKEALRKHSHGT